jgi:hypothetical protein
MGKRTAIMASVDDIFDDMLDVNLSLMGEVDAVYTKSDSSTISLSVWWEDINQFQIDGYTAEVYKGIKVVGVKLADMADRQPVKGETFTINSVVYEVTGVLSNDGYVANLWVRS